MANLDLELRIYSPIVRITYAEVISNPHGFAKFSQESGADGMKRSNFYFFGDFCANGRGKPFSHLARCLIGECDRAYRFWIVATFFDKVHYT